MLQLLMYNFKQWCRDIILVSLRKNVAIHNITIQNHSFITHVIAVHRMRHVVLVEEKRPLIE